MKTQYLLPCSCGKKLPVEAGQAGQSVRCACGAALEVPTMKGLAMLERAAPADLAPVRRKHLWGLRQQLLLVGLLVALIGLGVAGYSYLRRPVPLDVQLLTPRQSWRFWLIYQRGLYARQQDIVDYLEIRRDNDNWVRLGLGIAAVGLLVTAGSLLIPDRRRKQLVGARRGSPDPADV